MINLFLIFSRNVQYFLWHHQNVEIYDNTVRLDYKYPSFTINFTEKKQLKDISIFVKRNTF